jgi:NTP pyrophosphatase (non-canonical NTP hydrolase)
MTQIEQLQKDIHDNAIKKGFWEDPVNLAEKLMLIVTEIAEMCEAHRKGKKMEHSIDAVVGWTDDEEFKRDFEAKVKDTFEDEMADTIIRLLDMAKRQNVDIVKHMVAKMRYNSLRPYKHGKAY